MNFRELIESRHSCRAFEKKAIEKEKLQFILDATTFAPSAGNLQAYTVDVVVDEDCKRKLAYAAHGQEFIRQAPVVLVFFAVREWSEGKYGVRGTVLYCVQDATIACTYAQLAATEVGLSSCWVGAFNENLVEAYRQGIKWSWCPVAILPIGYASAPLFSPSKVSRVVV